MNLAADVLIAILFVSAVFNIYNAGKGGMQKSKRECLGDGLLGFLLIVMVLVFMV